MKVILLYLRQQILNMDRLLANIKIQVNPAIYIKDPETTELGRKILTESIHLIDELGFDHFTFKKLGERIGSNESSIYRYFDNKHKLLIYLSSWYWSWIEYKLVFSTSNIADPKQQLMKAITVVTEKVEDDATTLHINESVLNRIIITEFTKTFLTKQIDDEIRESFFTVYNRIIYRIICMLAPLVPDYPFAKSFVSDMVEGSLHQHFLSLHLHSITNCNELVSPTDYYIDLTQRLINSSI
jgi:AcrR family transcriptional regulator